MILFHCLISVEIFPPFLVPLLIFLLPALALARSVGPVCVPSYVLSVEKFQSIFQKEDRWGRFTFHQLREQL